MSMPTPDETILGLLALQPQHGYQLLEHFRDPARLGGVWNLSTSQLYAVLKRLEKLGWIEGQQVETENAPPRTDYTLTSAGEIQLDNWLNERDPPPSIRRVRVECLSRLYVAHLLGIPSAPLIEYQRTACARELASQREWRDALPAGIGRLAADLHIEQLQAVITWLDTCAASF